jgi:hypothetical protein
VRKTTFLLVLIIVLLLITPTNGVSSMDRLYIVPSMTVPNGNGFAHGPVYFEWRFGTGYTAIQFQDYGFVNAYIVLANLSLEDHTALMANTDVFVYPENLDDKISQQDMADLRTIFESFNVPADWLTASNTYRELLQQFNGIISFANRYAVIAGEFGFPPGTWLFNDIDLDTQYSAFPQDVKAIFDATLESFEDERGVTFPSILPNMTVRQMLKAASDELKKPLKLGGQTF